MFIESEEQRAQENRESISLACEKYVYSLESIEAFTNFKIPVAKAGDDLFAEDKAPECIFI